MKIIKFNEEICVRSDMFLSANLKRYPEFIDNSFTKSNFFELDNRIENFFNWDEFMCLDVLYSDMRGEEGKVSISFYGILVHYKNKKFEFKNEITKGIDNALKIIEANNLMIKYDNIKAYIKTEHKELYDKIENNTKFIIKLKNDLIDFLMSNDTNECFNMMMVLNRMGSPISQNNENKIDIKVVV